MKKKILLPIGLLLLVSVCLVLATPYLFKGKMIRLIRAQANKNLRAHVNFSDANISLFRHFPKITLGLQNLQVTSVGEFEGDTLIGAKQFDIAFDLRSLISGDTVKLYSFTIDDPRIHLLRHKDGQTNWDIVKSSPVSGDDAEALKRPLNIGIKFYVIHNGSVEYSDEIKKLHVQVDHLEHEGSGNFSADLFRLKTKTTAGAIHVDYSGKLPYEVTANANLDLVFRVDNKTHTFSFNTDKVKFNDLTLHTEGFFQWINDSSYNMHVKFNSPSNEFKNFLSVLPSLYQKDFAGIQAGGKVIFNGDVRGKYDQKHTPAYHGNLELENAFCKFTDRPIAVNNLNLSLHLENPDGLPDHLTVDIPRGHVQINEDKADFHFSVRNPKSKPNVDMAFAGKVDLANVSKLLQADSGSRMSGLVDADFAAKGTIPQNGKQKKDQFEAKGTLALKDFVSNAQNGSRPVKLDDLLLSFNSKNVLLNKLNAEYLSTHIHATGAFENLFAYVINNKALTATIDLKADDLNLRDWMNADKSDNKSAVQKPVPFQVPSNVDFTITAGIEKLHYDDIDMQNLSAMMLVSDETIYLDHAKGEALEGTMIINGSYSTWGDKENPEIALNYIVQGLDVQKTFFAFNTLKKIMPVGKFISGKLSSQMSLRGNLGADMSPNLQSLHGQGSVTLTDGSMKEFGPLDKISQSLDISTLKEIQLNNVKADFKFSDNKVNVDPFHVRVSDIDMEIGGTHGFDQSLDYDIAMKIPRKDLGSKGNAFVKNVVTEAADKGIPVRLKDAVSMNVRLGGTINNPEVKTDMNATVDNAETDLKKEVNDFVNAKLDSAKQQLHHPQTSKKQSGTQTASTGKKHGDVKKSTTMSRKDLTHSKSKKKSKNTKKYYTSSKKSKSVAKK